jgi:hypothetical protein
MIRVLRVRTESARLLIGTVLGFMPQYFNTGTPLPLLLLT